MLIACNTSKKVVSRTSQKEQIRFGHGGGFTGAITEYCLKNNGELYKKAAGEITKISISKKEAELCFSKKDSIQFREITLDSPGNRYAFISHHGNDSIHRVTWNPHQPALSPSLIEFHNMLLALAGEEPMTILPEESADLEDDKMRKKEVIKKIKPIKKKAATNSTPADPLKQIDPEIIKKKKIKKLKKNKM